ncbi:MAG: transposase [Cyclobacteriaceae bacterium]
MIPHVVIELCLLGKYRCQPALQENYIDSKPLKVCHIKREHQHKVMVEWAAKGKGSMGWFYGFKLHAVINREAQLVNFLLTAGNIADNNYNVLNYLLKGIGGKFYGDKGYLSKLKEALLEKGVDLVAKMRSSSKKDALVLEKDAYYHRHRGLIETVIGQ